ncbi:hypothetical protein C8Q74DRAFT_1364938 [Fomes fomentarius]|nr:hypothetical protein C8Q74DRAFT_1364938 [Fomes fomentarius]
MSSLLSSTLAHSARNQHFVLLQSSAAQSCVSVLRELVKRDAERTRSETTVVLLCFLYPPSSLLHPSRMQQLDSVRVLDRTANVPGYEDTTSANEDWASSLKSQVLETIRSAPAGPLSVIIDSADTLLSDLSSTADTIRLLTEILAIVRARGGHSRLVLHTLAPSPLLPLLTQPRFSSPLTHLTAHPTALLTHLASAYLTSPPPLSAPEKFWAVFIPIAERHYESEKLVFGPGGEGGGLQEFVVEVLVRGGGAEGSGRRRPGVVRVLEGWSPAAGGACELRELDKLKTLWAKKPVFEFNKTQNTADPTQNLTFNLNLTPEQQYSRAQVPLPYVHEGKAVEKTQAPAAILYDPDSADDLDDDDPDEDLDI